MTAGPTPDPSPVSHTPALSRRARWIGAWVVVFSLFALIVWYGGGVVIARWLPSRVIIQTAAPETLLTPTVDVSKLSLPQIMPPSSFGLVRMAQVHTYRPERPRFEITKYTIQQGDTINGIAEKFGLKPSTIMWSNLEVLYDDPDMISIGMELVILPLDGAYHKWSEGEGLNGVSEYFHVKPDDIIDFPGNNLTRESVGDYSHPNIAPGTMLIIPGGRREYRSKVVTIPRSSPSVGSYLGPGACAAATGATVGTGSFVWPVVGTITQNFNPDTNHPALDIAAPVGTAIAAADSGVVVYSGPTYANIGYGNLVIIDHGNGWQTLYAHQGAIYVNCGDGILQGAAIGTIGMTGRTTGPHLHFQMTSSSYGKVNPLGYLP